MSRREQDAADRALLLIGTKLEWPKPPASLVARPHLIEALDQGRDGRVTLISASAGSGKTTLAGQWLGGDSSPPAAWLSLDPLDNDIERFTRYVIAALRQVEEGCLPETQRMLSARAAPPPRYLAESMLAEVEKLRRRVVLILDDYGVIRAPAVHELLASLVASLPGTLHLVVLSRIDPPLPLTLWRSRHWLRELRTADLRFSREETGAFFDAAHDLRLSREGIHTIHRKTEGWVAGLRLTQLSLTGAADPEGRVRAFSANDRLVADFLMEEVLSRQPPEIKEFLAVTCVLERFKPQLCDELLAGSNRESPGRSRELLDRLFRQNLFLVPLGSTHGWYRYHHLFRQLLLERFDELASGTRQTDILKRAGDWFCDEGWIEDGLKCYLAANDLDSAADVVGNHLHDVMANDLSRRTLFRWLEMFPAGAERTRLPLLIASAYMRSLRSDYEGVHQILEEIDGASGDTRGDWQRRWWKAFEGDLDSLRAFVSYWKGDLERAREHGARVFDQSSPRGSLVRALASMYYGGSLALTGRWADYRRLVEHGTTEPGFSDSPQQLPYLVVQGSVHLYRGELAQCQAVASGLTTRTDFAIPKYFEAIGFLLLGIVAYERNQLDAAERLFLAVESRRFDAAALVYHSAVTGLAKVEMARGNLGPAEGHAATALEFAVESQSSMLIRASKSVERYLAVAAGKPPEPAAPPLDPDFMQLSILAPSSCWAWGQIQSPAFETRQVALEFVEAALQLAKAHGVTRRVIQLTALRALALDAQDRRDEALSILEASLQRGAALGCVRSYVDCGEGIRPLLLAVAERRSDGGYAAQLVDAIDASLRRPQTQAGSAHLRDLPAPGAVTHVDDLTNREVDVLELLQRRLSNKEIASQLGISPGTVKMHTLNIYRKLGVGGRRQAVAVAIERGLIGH